MYCLLCALFVFRHFVRIQAAGGRTGREEPSTGKGRHAIPHASLDRVCGCIRRSVTVCTGKCVPARLSHPVPARFSPHCWVARPRADGGLRRGPLRHQALAWPCPSKRYKLALAFHAFTQDGKCPLHQRSCNASGPCMSQVALYICCDVVSEQLHLHVDTCHAGALPDAQAGLTTSVASELGGRASRWTAAEGGAGYQPGAALRVL